MSSATRPIANQGKPVRVDHAAGLQMSAQDKASSIVLVVLVSLGMFVLMMFGAWLSSRLRYEVPAIPVVVVDDLGGGGGGKGTAPGVGDEQLEEVNPAEVKDLQEVSVEQSLRLVTDAVAAQSATFEGLPDGSEGGGGIGGGEGGGIGRGIGTGTGDGRGPGPGGKGTAKELPDWEVRFNGTTIELYAQQLDHFGIELAAVGGGIKTVDYASKLSQPTPVVRQALGTAEKRRFLFWRKGTLAAADKALLDKAGIANSGRVILQFLPEQVENQMRLLEAQYAKGKKLQNIKRTVFGVRGGAGAYEFYVLEQDYR